MRLDLDLTNKISNDSEEFDAIIKKIKNDKIMH